MSAMTDWYLIGDIGGTNARFAITAPGSSDYRDIASYEVANVPDFGLVLDQLMRDITAKGLATGTPSAICLAVAGPPHVESISFTNSSWRFSLELLRERTGAPRIEIINDFCAVARAIPALSPSDLEQIGEGHNQPNTPAVALGPGTGTGVAALAHSASGEPVVITGEGGHVDFAPVTDVEVEIHKRLRARYGRVSIERLLCGVGIVNIYQALADYRHQAAPLMHPGDIGTAASSGEDPLAREAMAMFFAVLGASAGNLALTFGARGGVYIAGGIAPRYIELMRLSDFRARFLAKGRFADYLSGIPTFVVTHPGIGLLGAAMTLTE